VLQKNVIICSSSGYGYVRVQYLFFPKLKNNPVHTCTFFNNLVFKIVVMDEKVEKEKNLPFGRFYTIVK